jgi:hypothetical protein
MVKIWEGGCACGAVRYSFDVAPLYVHACHCTSCQVETGGAFAVNAMIETDRLSVIKGEPVKVVTPSESGRGQTIARCPQCFVALWSHYGGLGDKAAFVRVGTLDERAGIRPDMHIFTRSKAPWFEIPKDAKAVDVYYDTRAEWPAESLARRKAMLGK